MFVVFIKSNGFLCEPSAGRPYLWNLRRQRGAKMRWELLGIVQCWGTLRAHAQVGQGWWGEESSVLCGCCLQDTHLGCIVNGSGPFSVISSHMEGWDTPLDVPRGKARGTHQSRGKGWLWRRCGVGMEEKREVLHRRLTREGAGLCKKGRLPLKLTPACSLLSVGTGKTGVFCLRECLHVMGKQKTKNEKPPQY